MRDACYVIRLADPDCTFEFNRLIPGKFKLSSEIDFYIEETEEWETFEIFCLIT